MSFKLWEITDMFKGIYNHIDSLEQITEEDREAIDNTLEMLNASLESKLENCYAMVDTWTSQAREYDEHIKRYTAMKKAELSKAQHLKDYMYRCMKEAKVDKVHTSMGDMRIAKNGGRRKLTIIDEENIPKEFIETISKVDTNKLRKAIKNKDVEEENKYWRLEPQGEHLRVPK